jgi:hypothetical protein
MRDPSKGLFDVPPLEMTSNDVAGYTNISPRECNGRAPLRSALRSWTWDAIALVIATIALAATILTLSTHQDRPLPAWPWLISVNAFIAIFMAILKTALLVYALRSLANLSKVSLSSSGYGSPTSLAKLLTWSTSMLQRKGHEAR